MKEIRGLIDSIPKAARNRQLRWHLGYMARVAVLESARYAKAAVRLIAWYAVTLIGYTVYKSMEVRNGYNDNGKPQNKSISVPDRFAGRDIDN